MKHNSGLVSQHCAAYRCIPSFFRCHLTEAVTGRRGKIMSVLTVLGAICGQEAVAPLAGQPRPAGTSGSGHVNPNISHPDQLPQHQTDHSCVTRQEQAHNLRRIRGSGLNLSVPFKHEMIYRADSGPHCFCVSKEPSSSLAWREKPVSSLSGPVYRGLLSWGILYMMVLMVP